MNTITPTAKYIVLPNKLRRRYSSISCEGRSVDWGIRVKEGDKINYKKTDEVHFLLTNITNNNIRFPKSDIIKQSLDLIFS